MIIRWVIKENYNPNLAMNVNTWANYISKCKSSINLDVPKLFYRYFDVIFEILIEIIKMLKYAGIEDNSKQIVFSFRCSHTFDSYHWLEEWMCNFTFERNIVLHINNQKPFE